MATAKEKSTALATIERNKFLALRPESGIAEAIEANYGAGARINEQDMTRIPTPTGGLTTWSWESAMGDESAKEVQGILAWHQVRGILWPTEDPSNLPPVLVTHDLVEAKQIGSEMGDIDPAELRKYQLDNGNYNWEALPWNQWGSGKNGGKRCKEQMALFILRENDAWPCIVLAQPGSLKNLRQFISKLTMQGIPHYRAVIALGLSKEKNKAGQDYSQIKPRLTGLVTQEVGEKIRSMYTEPLSCFSKKLSIDPQRDATDE